MRSCERKEREVVSESKRELWVEVKELAEEKEKWVESKRVVSDG